MKKTIIGLLAIGLSLAGGGAVFADEPTKTIIGEPTGEIPVKGDLGIDNTRDNQIIPEGDDGWINVTLPTATMFYNVKGNKTIKSPEYTIVNNAARGVKVSLGNFAVKDGESPSVAMIDTLDLQSVADSNKKLTLIAGSQIAPATNAELATLASGEKTGGSTAVPAGADFSYKYTGNIASDWDGTEVKNFTLTLNFQALPKPASETTPETP